MSSAYTPILIQSRDKTRISGKEGIWGKKGQEEMFRISQSRAG